MNFKRLKCPSSPPIKKEGCIASMAWHGKACSQFRVIPCLFKLQHCPPAYSRRCGNLGMELTTSKGILPVQAWDPHPPGCLPGFPLLPKRASSSPRCGPGQSQPGDPLEVPFPADRDASSGHVSASGDRVARCSAGSCLVRLLRIQLSQPTWPR